MESYARIDRVVSAIDEVDGEREEDVGADPISEPGHGARENLRLHLRRAFLRMALLIPLDFSLVLSARWAVRQLRRGAAGPAAADFVGSLLPPGAISGAELAGAVVIGMFAVGAYRAGHRWRDPIRVVAAVGIGVFLSVYGDLWGPESLIVGSRALGAWVAICVVLVPLRFTLGSLVDRIPKERFDHKVLEIGAKGGNWETVDLGRAYKSVGFLRIDQLPDDIEEMEHWLEGGVDTLVVSGRIPPEEFGRLTDFALAHGCRLLCAPRTPHLGGVDPRRLWLGGRPFSELTAPSLRASQLFIKRMVDIVGSSILLIALSPLLLALVIAVRLDSPGPILFKQGRAAYRGGFFRLLKFRSMREDAEAVLRADEALYAEYVKNDYKLPESEDPRITPLGGFMRKTSLDELPQLLNVLRGDMSLVGPRPVVEPELEMYRGRIPALLSVKPGMTGPWQISGRSSVGFPERAEIDLDYVRNWSLLRDFWILLMTIPAVLLQRGAH